MPIEFIKDRYTVKRLGNRRLPVAVGTSVRNDDL